MSTYDPSTFAMVPVVAGVVIVKDGKVLLVQEAFEKVRGLWNLPAGHVDIGETLEQAAKREAKEETGLDVELGAHLITVHSSLERPVLHAYLVTNFSGEISFDKEELLDVKWFDANDIMSMDGLRNNEYIRGAIEAALKVSK